MIRTVRFTPSFYVSQQNLGHDYFLNVPGYNPFPAGASFEILTRIGDGDTEYMYDAGRDTDTEHELMYARNLDSDAIDQHPRGFPTQRPFVNAGDTDTSRDEIFMYRYRPPTARSHIEHNEPWRPNQSGLYHARLRIPKAAGVICPLDFQLDAYDPPQLSDGTPVTGLLDPFRQNTPVDTDGASTAPVVTFDSWEERYGPTGYTRQDATRRTIHIALGGTIDSDSEHLLSEHISNIFHDQPADSFFAGIDSDTESILTSQYSGRFELYLSRVSPNPHGITDSEFDYDRTQIGLWPTVTTVTDASRQSRIVYPTVTVAVGGQTPIQPGAPASAGHTSTFELTNPNPDKQTDVSTMQIMQQFKDPITASGSFESYAAGDTRIPSELRGIADGF